MRSLLALAVLFAGVASLPALAQNELFVGNAGNNSVTVFSRTASGDTAPIRTLVGAATGLSFIQGLAVDVTNNELFVANGSGPAIKVYSLTASGNTAPLRTLTGAATGMSQPVYIAVDPVNNELFVTNGGNQTITVYSRTASGDVAPIRTLSTVPAGNAAVGLTLDLTNNELVVGTSGSTIDVYSRTASGNTPALRTLGGPATGLIGPIGLGVDLVNDELFAANPSVSSPTVTVYGRTASGNTAPSRTLAGAATGLVGPHALTLDLTNNELFVGNTINANSITVYARGASGNTAPVRTLAGAATGISGPVGIAVTTGVVPPPGLLALVSRKVHGAAGTFDLPLSFLSPPNINHNPTTESRQGPAQTIVFTFDKAITNATVSISEGVATAGTPTISGNDVVVGLTNVADRQYVTVSLTNVASTDGGAGGVAAARVGFLTGDVNQSRVVTLTDLGLVNAQLAQAVTAANYLKDVNASGTLTLADKAITNGNLTGALPAP